MIRCFLQFDGTSDEIYRRIRGRDLLAQKLAAVEACGRNEIGVVLVPTLVPDINTNDIGAMLENRPEAFPHGPGHTFSANQLFRPAPRNRRATETPDLAGTDAGH